MNFGKGASRQAGGILSIEEIEKRRRAIDVSVDELCNEAGITARGYYNMRAGATKARRMSRSKLTKAIVRLAHERVDP